jgi:hypothetical protein
MSCQAAGRMAVNGSGKVNGSISKVRIESFDVELEEEVEVECKLENVKWNQSAV